MALKVTIMPLDIDADAKPVIQTIDKEEITIGRLPSNDIVLNRPEVSGIHARLRVDTMSSPNQSKLFITDLGSSNGTMVEKNPLRPRVEVAMLSNERIFIGNFVIKPVVHVEEVEETQEFSIPSGTTEMRRNYLSEALKEYEEGTSSDEFSKNIEERIDRFAEERAVANGVSLSSSYDFEPKKVEETRTAASISSLFSQPKELDEDYDHVDESEDEPSSLYPNVTRDFTAQVETRKEKEDVSEYKVNPIAEAFNAKKSYSTVEDVVDALTIKVKVESNDVTAFNFTAAAYATLRGKVTHKGKPLTQVKVRGLESDAYTDNEGNFEFPKVLEGSSYTLTFEKDKFVFEPSTLDGKVELDVAPLVTHATQLFSISGVVSHHGKPLVGVTVDGGALGKVVTGPDGSYKFENVPEGQEYDLTLSKDGYAFVK